MKSIPLQFLQILFIVASIAHIASAQPDVEWVRTYGGSLSDIGQAIAQTDDGGYISVGGTASDDVNVSGNSSPGFDEWWVIKVDNIGDLQWQKCFGTVDGERAMDVKSTPDNGCIVAGYVSDDESNSNHNGIRDYWVTKLDSQGEIEWQRFYGGTPSENAYTISLTADGGFIVAGSRFIYKLDALGNIEWEKRYDGSKSDIILSILQTNDLGYIAAGYSLSDDGDVGKNQGEEDVWVIKLATNGDLEWSKSYGGSREDRASSVLQSDDGGYIVGGYTESTDGDVENNYGDEDYWILKLDADGNLEWEKTFGGQKEDKCQSLLKLSTDGYIVSGWSRSNDVDLTDNKGLIDVWIFKMDNNGNLEWEKNYGGDRTEQCFDLKETMDGGFVATGNTYSDNDFGDEGLGSGDLWIMKLAPLSVGLNESLNELNISVFPNPNSGSFTVNLTTLNTFADIRLVDVNGKIILNKINVGQSVYVDYLSNGIYFLSVTSENKSYYEKIIIQNN